MGTLTKQRSAHLQVQGKPAGSARPAVVVCAAAASWGLPSAVSAPPASCLGLSFSCNQLLPCEGFGLSSIIISSFIFLFKLLVVIISIMCTACLPYPWIQPTADHVEKFRKFTFSKTLPSAGDYL